METGDRGRLVPGSVVDLPSSSWYKPHIRMHSRGNASCQSKNSGGWGPGHRETDLKLPRPDIGSLETSHIGSLQECSSGLNVNGPHRLPLDVWSPVGRLFGED